MPNDERNPLIEYLNKLRGKAIEEQPTSKLNQFEKYYLGQQQGYNLKNFSNIIKTIVQAKVTMVLDAQIGTAVRPRVLRHASFDQLKNIEDLAQVMNGALDHVKKDNNFDQLKKKIVKRAAKTGLGIVEIVWNQDKNEGMGDEEIGEINPKNFYPDPDATKLDNANYVFIRSKDSIFSLKKKYQDKPEIIKKLNALVGQQTDVGQPLTKPNVTKDQSRGIRTAQNDQNVAQFYIQDTYGGIKQAQSDIEVWKCYIKDDSIWIKGDDTGSQEPDEQKEVKAKNKFKYPNGRVIIYAGTTILEDKPIDYPFGYPFEIFYWEDTDTIWGKGEVEDLIQIQDRINRAYRKVQEIVAKFKIIALIDPTSGIDKNDFNRFDILQVGPGGLLPGKTPVIITNKYLEEVARLIEYIKFLKEDAKEISRINDTMLSGARPSGVTSGKMIEDLNESPLTSIRDVQRNFKDFLASLSEKAVTLIQLYYKQGRIIRIMEGKNFALIPPRVSEEMEGSEQKQIEIFEEVYDQEKKEKQFQSIKQLQGDLSTGEYEVEVTAGSELPMNKMVLAQLTQQLAAQGIFGDPNDIEVRELVLKTLDYPNYRAVIDHIKARGDEEAAKPPVPVDFVSLLQKGVTASLGDIVKVLEMLPDSPQKDDAIKKIGNGLGLYDPNQAEQLQETPPQDVEGQDIIETLPPPETPFITP